MVSRRTREVYDRSARQYATRNANMREEVAETGARFMQMLRERPRVLDLGCGTGRDMAWMEKQGASVIGADLSEGMLAEARGIVRGPLVQADMRQIPFADASFDGVWCMASMLHVPRADAPTALGEIRRVLVSGGVLLLGLQMGDGETWEKNPYGEGDRFFARYSEEEAIRMVTQADFIRPLALDLSTPHQRWLHVLTYSMRDTG